MKFGEALQQNSVPAFRRHNIDYDDIKRFIKDQTSPGAGKAISIPGRSDERLLEFENELFSVLRDQHDRIGIFVKCKVGEVQRRQSDCTKLLQKLAARAALSNDHRATVNRLQRYERLEADIIRAADELKSLARFNANQRTAFRKLLKKYRKWTGSSGLEDRFRDDVLDDPKSFTKLDLGPLLDEYSSTQQKIRSLYEQTIVHAPGTAQQAVSPQVTAQSTVVGTLRAAVESTSMVQFDISLATTPLGRSGSFATYFVHPENIVELQMFLLQHAQYHSSRSRSNSLVSPASPSHQAKTSQTFVSNLADFHLLAADCLQRYAKDQSALTISDREDSAGSVLQRSKATVCWNRSDEAMVALRSHTGLTKTASFKSKRAQSFFNRDLNTAAKKDTTNSGMMQEIQRELARDNSLQQLFELSCCRTRFVGLKDDADAAVMLTLDTNIHIQGAGRDGRTPPTVDSVFPYALLAVRQEGRPSDQLIPALDESHLVERVRGFSLEYHAVWQIHRPSNMSPPIWLPLLERDIRKLPPASIEQRSNRGYHGKSGAPSAGSIGSATEATDSTTAVETANETSQVWSPSQVLSPPSSKKLRIHPEIYVEPQVRYWSEYDHPEDGQDGEDVYVLYIDPHERSIFDRFFEKAGRFFGLGRGDDQHHVEHFLGSPATDDETSDEEAGLASARHKSYGTLRDMVKALPSADRVGVTRTTGNTPQLSFMCFAASLIILAFAFILAFTGRHRYIREVQAGIIAAVVSCLAFAITGFLAALRHPGTGMLDFIASFVVLIFDGIACGGLVAWYIV